MVRQVVGSERVPIKIWTDDIEAEALQQLKNIARLPFVFKQVAAMPDVHAGKGSTIGSVVATDKAIVPSMVGVDIGCGKGNLESYCSCSHGAGRKNVSDTGSENVHCGRPRNTDEGCRMQKRRGGVGRNSQFV